MYLSPAPMLQLHPGTLLHVPVYNNLSFHIRSYAHYTCLQTIIHDQLVDSSHLDRSIGSSGVFRLQ